jgi:hypothetical protein
MQIKVWNSAYRDSEVRHISLKDVNIIAHRMDYSGRPYILFEHNDYPLGPLRADFHNDIWECDLN